jgi:hypothetical protein
MFERIANSFELAQCSWRVLRDDKKLIVFPILSAMGCILVLVSFAIPLALVAQRGGFADVAAADNGRVQLPIWTYLMAFAFYFCNYFVIVFCNSALVSCALMRFAGEEPTIGDGLAAATSRLPQIIAWSLVSATVGVVLKLIENAHEKVGQIVSAILGTAWTVVTYFVVPILVVEKVGPIEAVKRSASLLRKTWGEALVGHWGLGLFMFLLALPGIALLIAGVVLLGKSAVLGAVLIGLAIVYFLGESAVGSALNTIFLSALYQFAAYQTVPQGFSKQIMRSAFSPRGSEE